MTDRDFADVLRLKALQLLEDAVRKLQLHWNNETGSMAAHVAKDNVLQLRLLARHLEALANVAETIR